MTDTKLTRGILEEAGERAEALLAKARSQADALIAEAEKKAEKARSAEEARRKDRLDMIRDTEARAIEGLDRVYSLRHEEDAVDRVMKLLDRKLDEYVADPVRRSALLSDLITEAALAVGTDEVVISSSEPVTAEVLKECGKILREEFGLEISLRVGSDVPSSFGVIATDPGNRIIFDDTLFARINRSSREIRHIVGEAACRKE